MITAHTNSIPGVMPGSSGCLLVKREQDAAGQARARAQPCTRDQMVAQLRGLAIAARRTALTLLAQRQAGTMQWPPSPRELLRALNREVRGGGWPGDALEVPGGRPRQPVLGALGLPGAVSLAYFVARSEAAPASENPCGRCWEAKNMHAGTMYCAHQSDASRHQHPQHAVTR